MKKELLPFLSIAILLVLLSGCVQPDDDSGTGTGDGTGNGTGSGIGPGDIVDTETVQKGDKVAVEYKGTLADGTQFDASEGRGPLEFTAGAGQMIKGFDAAVIGMMLNEETTIEIPAAEAYGESDPSKVTEIPLEQINDAEKLKVGMSVTSSQGVNGVVKEKKETTIVIDFNHPLAGKELTFWIKIVKIEK